MSFWNYGTLLLQTSLLQIQRTPLHSVSTSHLAFNSSCCGREARNSEDEPRLPLLPSIVCNNSWRTTSSRNQSKSITQSNLLLAMFIGNCCNASHTFLLLERDLAPGNPHWLNQLIFQPTAATLSIQHLFKLSALVLVPCLLTAKFFSSAILHPRLPLPRGLLYSK